MKQCEQIVVEDSEESEDDEVFGPSIYTVNEQYIKPVTAEAGKMSWALMRNPDGLDCDLFVSHAWQEGIFEFLSKVLSSWPRGARHAWCCMLANPQNLNIGSMLQSPKTSPFALALQASRYVLVVPNRHRSVYTRLWCGYEAYVASEDAKTIQIATASALRAKYQTFVICAAPALIGFFMGMMGRVLNWDLRLPTALLTASAAFITSYSGHLLRQTANYVGLAASTCLELGWDPLRNALRFNDLRPEIETISRHLTWLAAISFFVIAELDRVGSDHIEREGHQLRKKYRGSIRFASCSQETDRTNIWDEIGDKEHEVDNAIHVLISAGMSSPSLRHAAQRGVDIEEAGHAETAIAVVFLGPLLVLCILNTTARLLFGNPGHLSWMSTLAGVISSVARLSFLLLLPFRAADGRSFMLKVITKLVATMSLPAVMSIGVSAHLDDHVALWTVHLTFLLHSWGGVRAFHLTFVVALFFALIGINGTLALPGGKCMLHFFLARQDLFSKRSSTTAASESETE